ncbi:MAG: ATP-dependent helicase [Kiritimatiellae bacterium]|nr:ATP-dependent helicase [Kiritimatiellia bacterium]
MTDWQSLLNPEQYQAVTASDGPLLVLAAAGTGKTHTLTYRVAYLIEQGVSPQNILLLTFTNRAAHEMLERAAKLVGPSISNLWSGTFHHVCHRILRRHAEKVGYTRSFLILDRDDATGLIAKALKARVTDTKHFPKKEVLAALIGKAANTQNDLRTVIEQTAFNDPIDPEVILAIARDYAEAKRNANAIDFDDLLVLTLKLFKENPDVLHEYSSHFAYVLVDEYQDTNTIQSQLVDLLASYHRNLMAVGDDFQCIYSWRGADFRNIMDFPKRWQGCQIIKLERNYRSVPEVLDVANAAIAGNPEQFQKTLKATRAPSENRPLVAFLRDAGEQSQLVMRHILRALHAGYAPTDIAVLYRSHFHVIELEMELRRQRIDYTLTSGQGVFESAHAKDVIAYLRFCSGGTDMFAFQRMMSLLQGVGPKTAEKIWHKMGEQFDGSRETDRLKLLSFIPKKAQSDWQIIDALIGDYHKEQLEYNGNRAVSAFLNTWYEAYLQRTFDNAEERYDDIAALAAQFERGAPVANFLHDVALMTNVDAEQAQAMADNPGIRLTTVHQAKGLEWPLVIILWCNDDMFPSAKALAENQEAEERRLFYVAITRAKDDLLLCVPATRRLANNGGTLYLKPSRFLKELPNALVSKRYGIY